MKKYKVIIDTDPGVDDTTALTFALNDPQYDIKLLSIAWGNCPIKNAVRNACHLCELFGREDIPVVEGYSKRFGKNREEATHLHMIEGMGGYNPPKTTKKQPIDKDCADAMYEILKENPGEISMVILGPHTNFAHLLQKHPDAKDLIKNIVMESAAPNGLKTDPNYISFNIRPDAPAFKYTIDSKLPVYLTPSNIGRDEGFFTKDQVEEIKNTNDVGRFLAKTFETYWEVGFEKFDTVASNDLCGLYYISHPHLSKTKRAFIHVDTETGKTTAIWDKKGNFVVVTKLKRKKFLKFFFNRLKEMSHIKIADIDRPKQEETKTKSKTPAKKTPVAKKPTAKTVTTKSAKTEAKVTSKPEAKKTTKQETKVESAVKKTTKTSIAKSANKGIAKSSAKSNAKSTSAKSTKAPATKTAKKATKK